MTRRLLDLCLLAYPRARRQRDRDYLRDLALELAERQGLARQAWSLLGAGLKERFAPPSRRTRRICIAAVGAAAVAISAGAATGPAQVDRQVERVVCPAASSSPCARGS